LQRRGVDGRDKPWDKPGHDERHIGAVCGVSLIESLCIHVGMSRKKLTAEELAELARLVALPDDEIDTKDIPEAPAENWIHARRGEFYQPLDYHD
jgi:hypothetical protein